MNMKYSILSLAFIVGIQFTGAANENLVEPRPYYGKIAKRLPAMLPRYHVLQQKLDDTISQRAWTNLVTFYDFDHSVFLKSDLDKLAKRQFKLDDEINAGDVSFGYDVYRIYVERLKERIDFATNLLARGEWDFSIDENYRIKRKDAPWPISRAAAEEHWRKRMKNEVLASMLAKELDKKNAPASTNNETIVFGIRPLLSEMWFDSALSLPKWIGATEPPTNSLYNSCLSIEKTCFSPAENEDSEAAENARGYFEVIASKIAADANTPHDTPEQTLIKKYRQYMTVFAEPDEETVLQYYFSAIARAYDPHTDYMSPASKEDFDMDMNLTLCGVGAVLQMDDGALKIVEIMPGGPVDVDGRIEEGDHITGVRQSDGPMEDITWQPMRKTIRKIRGPKGSRVTLEIVPRSDPTGSTKKLIELVRDEIKLEDQAATGRVEVVESELSSNRLGYIYLPGFYGTMEKRMSDPGFRSCAMDVARYLADFNADDVEGLVLDLRGNGGGSLREAVMLSALFVNSGPVVQIRDTRSVGALPIPPGNPVAFRRPMVVLIDRASASASEIVAGHLQDVGRAIVLGDSRTHGKGTVQTVMGMGPEKYGSCKITTARFYRINGRSTQVEGVASDIVLPSLLDSLEIGEDKLTYALPFSRILPAEYVMSWNMPEFLPQLRKASAERLEKDARYLKHLENVAGMKEISNREEVPLEYSARLEMMRADRELRELDEENENENDDVAANTPTRRKRNERPKDDVVLDEAFRILQDLVILNEGREVPKPRGWWE